MRKMDLDQADPILFLSDARGVYIPRDFAHAMRDAEGITGISDTDWQTLEAGPDNELYWETWTHVMENCQIADKHGRCEYFTLYQDGDLWLIPEGMVWSSDDDWFVWPEKGGYDAA